MTGPCAERSDMEETREKISLKQLMVLLFCGLLSPMLRQIPRHTAERAGAGGWLGPLLALPVFLLALWLLAASFRRLPKGTGLGGLYRLAFGPVLGRAASVVTAGWLLLLTGVGLRFYAEDFISSIYLDTDLWLFLVIMMVLVWWVSSRGMATVCRMSQVFFYGLCAVVGLTMVLGIPEVEVYHIWPFWLEGWPNVSGSALPVLAVLGHSIPILFRRDKLGSSQGGMAVAAAWFSVLCLVLAVLDAVIIGVFGWQLTERMQMPFFSLVKEGSTLNIVERLESVVAGVWVFSDLALFSAQLLAAEELTKDVVRRLNGRWVLGVMSVVAMAAAVWISPSSFQLRTLWRDHIQKWDWAVCYLLPLLACLVMVLKGQKRTTRYSG